MGYKMCLPFPPSPIAYFDTQISFLFFLQENRTCVFWFKCTAYHHKGRITSCLNRWKEPTECFTMLAPSLWQHTLLLTEEILQVTQLILFRYEKKKKDPFKSFCTYYKYQTTWDDVTCKVQYFNHHRLGQVLPPTTMDLWILVDITALFLQ